VPLIRPPLILILPSDRPGVVVYADVLRSPPIFSGKVPVPVFTSTRKIVHSARRLEFSLFCPFVTFFFAASPRAV